MTLTAQQPKGRCVWGLEQRSRSVESCFVEKSVRRFVPPICWDFLADCVCVGGGGGLLMGCWRGYYNENTGTFWPDVQHLDYPTRKRGVRVSKEAGTHTLTPVHKG